MFYLLHVDPLLFPSCYHVVICHVPPAPEQNAWHGDLEVKKKFASILNNADVDVMLCAHYHCFAYYPNLEGVNFPVIINSNNSYLTGEADNEKLKIQVVSNKGKKLLKKDFPIK